MLSGASLHPVPACVLAPFQHSQVLGYMRTVQDHIRYKCSCMCAELGWNSAAHNTALATLEPNLAPKGFTRGTR
jgi:hypothetical protein